MPNINLPEMTLSALVADQRIADIETPIEVLPGVTVQYVGDINGLDTEHAQVRYQGRLIAEIGDGFLYVSRIDSDSVTIRSHLNRILGDNQTGHAVMVRHGKPVLLAGSVDVRVASDIQAPPFESAMLHLFEDGHYEAGTYNDRDLSGYLSFYAIAA